MEKKEPVRISFRTFSPSFSSPQSLPLTPLFPLTPLPLPSHPIHLSIYLFTYLPFPPSPLPTFPSGAGTRGAQNLEKCVGFDFFTRELSRKGKNLFCGGGGGGMEKRRWKIGGGWMGWVGGKEWILQFNFSLSRNFPGLNFPS